MSNELTPAQIDASLRVVVDAHTHASLVPPPPPDPSPIAAALSLEAAHTMLEVAENAGAIHLASGAAVLAAPISAGIVLAAGVAEIAHAWEEHERRAMEVDHEQMRGALLYMLGRTGDPDRESLVTRIGTNARDGAQNAEAFERRRPAAYARLAAEVRAHHRDGESAALRGQGRSAEVRRRLAEDPVFRMGFEEMERLRARDPAGFAARAQALARLDAHVDAGRHARVRG